MITVYIHIILTGYSVKAFDYYYYYYYKQFLQNVFHKTPNQDLPIHSYSCKCELLNHLINLHLPVLTMINTLFLCQNVKQRMHCARAEIKTIFLLQYDSHVLKLQIDMERDVFFMFCKRCERAELAELKSKFCMREQRLELKSNVFFSF